ncbi:thiamine phosphate synthase [Campylobacter pinnipediorum subsp. pinnipediorum]|nr:thiamine phosphate synthase [Campylobacter pinnipediorum subsp. pinnipediorum]AQW83621.1 thiamine phosphate synthase [Campylobacter pinnipediorum subsp. pinnipediorum]AQW85143.1 thiamine phosphate synthase [Campylobacter pinnipediorum subsp. pinnipediorum]
MEEMNNENLYRVIDANLNRLREGIRVVEDICRYGFNNQPISLRLKQIRHQTKIDQTGYINFRDSSNDVLKTSTKSEQKRENLNEILIANLKRAQESSRVLEECFKIIDTGKSELFKKIRYEIYTIEKDIFIN